LAAIVVTSEPRLDQNLMPTGFDLCDDLGRAGRPAFTFEEEK